MILLTRHHHDGNTVPAGTGSPAKWHAANCPGLCSTSGGTTSLQMGNRAIGQRVWKTHPDGGLSGVGMSPFRMMRLFFSVGSGTGTAESSAFVYGWSGSA